MLSLPRTAATALRMLALAGVLMAPMGAIAYSKASGLGIGKHGAGLVLFVTLQRQSMI